MYRDTASRTDVYEHERTLFNTILNSIHKQNPSVVGLELGDFPNNIRRWIWTHPGEDNGEPWLLLCELTNGSFALYTARVCTCCYRGFTEKARVAIVVTATLADMIPTMSDEIYKAYFEETVPADVKGNPLNPEDVV